MATSGTDLSFFDASSLPSGEHMRVGIAVAEWNGEITENLYRGAVDTLSALGVVSNNIHTYRVPGAFELPHACKKLIDRHQLSAVIAIGSVIQGETKHFDFICQSTAQGIMNLNTDQNVPVIFCVLTDNNLQQAIDRSGGKHGNKGVEAAVAAVKMAAL